MVVGRLRDFEVKNYLSQMYQKNSKGSRWENGYAESLKCKLRDELLNREIFRSLKEVRYNSAFQNTAELPNTDSLTHPGTKTGIINGS